MKYLFLLLFSFLLASAVAQEFRLPANGDPGIPGRVPQSFVMQWGEVPGAIAYEYLLTDNSECFVGCAGDTRQQRVNSQFAIEFDLQEDTTYYWILQAHFADGDSTGWSVVYSFRATTPAVENALRLLSPSGPEGLLLIDWGGLAEVQEIQLSLLDAGGRAVRPEGNALIWQGLRPANGFERFQRYSFSLAGLQVGIYYARFALKKGNRTEWVVRKLVRK